MLHHVSKLAANPDKYDYLPDNVKRLVVRTTTYKSSHGLEHPSPSTVARDFKELVDAPSPLCIEDDQDVNEVEPDTGGAHEDEGGEEEAHREEDELVEDLDDDDGVLFVPDFKDKDGLRDVREKSALLNEHGSDSDSSVEITGIRLQKCEACKEQECPVKNAELLKGKNKRKAPDDGDDSSAEARAAPVASAKKGGQKAVKGPTLMKPQLKNQSKPVLVEEDLKSPFNLSERKPAKGRYGEWYVLQAPGGPGARYTQRYLSLTKMAKDMQQAGDVNRIGRDIHQRIWRGTETANRDAHRSVQKHVHSKNTREKI